MKYKPKWMGWNYARQEKAYFIVLIIILMVFFKLIDAFVGDNDLNPMIYVITVILTAIFMFAMSFKRVKK